jgi:hypothetical protein
LIRLLLIPVAGTLAALLAIVVFRQPREDEPRPATRDTPPFHLPSPDEILEPEDEGAEDAEPEEGEDQPADEPPPAPPRTYQFQVAADGRLQDVETGAWFADPQSVFDTLATDERVRHTLRLAKATAEVDDAAFDAVVKKLEERFEVRRVDRASEKEGR